VINGLFGPRLSANRSRVYDLRRSDPGDSRPYGEPAGQSLPEPGLASTHWIRA